MPGTHWPRPIRAGLGSELTNLECEVGRWHRHYVENLDPTLDNNWYKIKHQLDSLVELIQKNMDTTPDDVNNYLFDQFRNIYAHWLGMARAIDDEFRETSYYHVRTPGFRRESISDQLRERIFLNLKLDEKQKSELILTYLSGDECKDAEVIEELNRIDNLNVKKTHRKRYQQLSDDLGSLDWMQDLKNETTSEADRYQELFIRMCELLHSEK